MRNSGPLQQTAGPLSGNNGLLKFPATRYKRKSRISAPNKDHAAPIYPHLDIVNTQAARYKSTVTKYIFNAAACLFTLIKKNRNNSLINIKKTLADNTDMDATAGEKSGP